MRRVLITGGAGFIGANFTYFWSKHHGDDSLIVFDSLTYAGNASTLAPLMRSGSVTLIQGDVCDGATLNAIFVEHAIDTVVHFAAESHVDRSIVSATEFVRTNVLGTQTLLDTARRNWYTDGRWNTASRFHHVSTDEVYGSLNANDSAFTESTPYSPNSPYAASKAGADHLVRASIHTFGLPATISNCSNNYGPFQFPEKLIPLVIVNALTGKKLPIYGDGKQIRDWLYVDDHCAAIERILTSGIPGRTYNVGGRAEHFNLDIVKQICLTIDELFQNHNDLRIRFPNCPAAKGTTTSSLIQHVKDRPGHDRRYAVDLTRIATELQFEPRETLETGLQTTIRWYLDNEDWWTAVLDGSYRNWIKQQYGG